MAQDHAKTWNFDEYDWVDSYDRRMRDIKRLCYEETLYRLPKCAAVKAGDSVLDLGTGTGNTAVPFLELGCRVVGLDPSQRMLQQAEAKVAQWAGRFSVQQIEEPFLHIPFPDRTFDGIMSAYAIHHLDDPAKQLADIEMKRVLKPGGHIAIADTMFRDMAHKYQALAEYSDLEEEYQPLLTTFPAMFEREGLGVTLHQIGELLWILVAQ